jgi:hypothetical protein
LYHGSGWRAKGKDTSLPRSRRCFRAAQETHQLAVVRWRQTIFQSREHDVQPRSADLLGFRLASYWSVAIRR